LKINKNIFTFQEYYTDSKKNENSDNTPTDREAKTSNKFLHEHHPANIHSLKYDADDEQSVRENATSDIVTETSGKLANVDVPIVRTHPTMAPSKTDFNIELDTNKHTSKVNIFSYIEVLFNTFYRR
jgi:hypothetical protein